MIDALHDWSQRQALAAFKRDVARRTDFYDIMADSAAEGLAQVEVLQKIRQNIRGSDGLAILIDRVLRRLRGAEKSASGAQMRTLSTELKGMLPDAELAMIAAGESSGNVERGWRNAAQFARRQREMTEAVRGALAMPAFYLMAFVGLLLFMSFNLLPRFEAGRPRHQWPAMAQQLGWVADHVLWIVGGLIGLVVVGAIVLRWLNANWTGERRSRFDLGVPVFRAMAQLQGASFMMGMSAFMASGISFGEALARMQATASPYMRWQIKQIESRMRHGQRPEQALLKSSLLAPQYHWIIAVYGLISASDAARAYERIANEMARRTQRRLQFVLGRVLGMVMLMLLGAGVLVVYFSMYGIVTSGGL